MNLKREYPDQPRVGVGGVVISNGRTLLVRRSHPPLAGEWSIPGGMLELGETLEQGVLRELAEETGIEVEIVDLIGAFDRIDFALATDTTLEGKPPGPRYHFVILDYLCTLRGGTQRAGSDASDLAWVSEEELVNFGLTPLTTNVLAKAFAMARARKL